MRAEQRIKLADELRENLRSLGERERERKRASLHARLQKINALEDSAHGLQVGRGQTVAKHNE
jgi:hypothetical protein